MASETPLHFVVEKVRYEDVSQEDVDQSQLTRAEGYLLSTVSSIASNLKFNFRLGSTAYKFTGTSSYSDSEVFYILAEFLQPDTTRTFCSVVDVISNLLPNDAPLSNEVWSFGVICLKLAQQIPYSHSSHQKLARLLEHLAKSEKVTDKLHFGNRNAFHRPLRRLSEYMRKRLTEPSSEYAAHFINLHAFIANLYESHVFNADPTYAIWAMHDAFEVKSEKGLARDTCLLVAAQWILWNGQGLFMQVRFLGDVSSKDKHYWEPGELYDGEPVLSLHRWRFWKDGFKDASDEANESSDECKAVAAKAAYMMDAYEKNMMF